MKRRLLQPTSSKTAWKRVRALYSTVGLSARRDIALCEEGYIYANGVAALSNESDSRMALHDLAHWLVADLDRKDSPNFGLGPHPTFDEKFHAPRELSHGETVNEEAAACLVHVELVRRLFGVPEAKRISLELCVDFENGRLIFRPNDLALTVLRKRGLLTGGSRFRWPKALKTALRRARPFVSPRSRD